MTETNSSDILAPNTFNFLTAGKARYTWTYLSIPIFLGYVPSYSDFVPILREFVPILRGFVPILRGLFLFLEVLILFLEVLYLFLGGLFLFLEVLFLILPLGGLWLSVVLEVVFLNPILRGFENAKRYKIRNKKLLKLPRGGGENSSGGRGENFLRATRAHFCASSSGERKSVNWFCAPRAPQLSRAR